MDNSQKPLMRSVHEGSAVHELNKSAINAIKSTTAQAAKTETLEKTKKPKNGENSEENKEFLIDVIMRMIKKLGSKGKNSSKRFFKEIYKEVDDFSLNFKHDSLEQQFKLDFTLATSWPFLRCCLQVLMIEVLMVALAVITAIANKIQIEGNPPILNQALACAVSGVGMQLLMCGVTVFTSGDDDPNPSIRFRMFQYGISAVSFTVTCVMTTLEWSNLYRYHFIAEGTIPFLVSFFLIRMDGVIFIYKLVISILIGFCFVIYQHIYQGVYLHATDAISWQGSLSVMLLFSIWCVAFHRLEKSTRFEYLIDAIMETQADLVSEEILKSATVLNSILPQLVIEQILLDPNSIVYEEFTIISVLQLDIAGYFTYTLIHRFTAMSSTLEPAVILEMLNTLFTYFDHLTEEFNVEKITTIGISFLKQSNILGDAYVACSSFNPTANPKTGAISICLVGLQMQAYLNQQLNESEFVIKNVGKPVRMRVGIHTGNTLYHILTL